MHTSDLCSGRDDPAPRGLHLRTYERFPALGLSFFVPSPLAGEGAVRRHRWQANLSNKGFSLLDLLILLLVLALVLLAAVKQFGVYSRKPAVQPAPQEQPAGTQSSAASR